MAEICFQKECLSGSFPVICSEPFGTSGSLLAFLGPFGSILLETFWVPSEHSGNIPSLLGTFYEPPRSFWEPFASLLGIFWEH